MERTNFDTPITKVVMSTYTSFRIVKVDVTLNNSANILVIVYHQQDELENFTEIVQLTGDNYNNWGNDDNYINNYIKQYLEEKYSTNNYT